MRRLCRQKTRNAITFNQPVVDGNIGATPGNELSAGDRGIDRASTPFAILGAARGVRGAAGLVHENAGAPQRQEPAGVRLKQKSCPPVIDVRPILDCKSETTCPRDFDDSPTRSIPDGRTANRSIVGAYCARCPRSDAEWKDAVVAHGFAYDHHVGRSSWTTVAEDPLSRVAAQGRKQPTMTARVRIVLVLRRYQDLGILDLQSGRSRLVDPGIPGKKGCLLPERVFVPTLHEWSATCTRRSDSWRVRPNATEYARYRPIFLCRNCFLWFRAPGSAVAVRLEGS